MKKRIAICFSGQPRTWKKCLGYWSALITDPRFQIDVFCHAWDFNTPSNKLGRTDEIKKLPRAELSELLQAFNPIMSRIESCRTFAPVSEDQAMTNAAHLSQFYGIMACSQLKREHEIRHNFVYDAVIRARYDTEGSSNILDNVPDVEPDTFHGFDLRFSFAERAGQVSDLCWMSAGLLYDRIAQLYLDACSIKARWFQYQHGPEHLLFHHLKTNLIRIKDHKWTMSIRRENQQDAANGSDIW